jgi:DNA helicase-2/ATP-dependent DNA helicase PcrA
MDELSRLAGPEELGRNVVVRPGQPAPPPWDGAPRVQVDLAAAPPDGLRQRWQARQRTVIELSAGEPAADRVDVLPGPAWAHAPTRLVHADLADHVVWSNSVDGRDPAQPVYRWRDLAVAAGARTDGPADVVLADGTAAWCDGGPIGDRLGGALGDTAIVHRIAIERGSLVPLGGGRSRDAAAIELAPDQLAAVVHRGGAARIIAPAGSGKTRVLTERARELLLGWNVPPSAVCLVAFNERAAAEMRERTQDLPGLHVRTLNALGLAILDGRPPFAPRGPRHQVLDERAVREVLSGLVTVPRRRNTDPLAPWIDALAEIRLTLRDPAAVEADYDGEVDGLPEVFDSYRELLRGRHAVDFNEQIATAIEVLLTEPGTRAAAQSACRLLLVDEFQDLAPAHLLLIRLLASPELAVFGVGDDDQTIYGFSGATPEWLIGYASLFPGAGDHPLEVNYRCPPAVVDAARTLLTRNRRRVPKEIRPAADRARRSPGLRIELAAEVAAAHGVAGGGTTGATADAVAAALSSGAAPADVAVLARVNATLAPVQLVLRHRGVPVQQAIDERWLERTGVRSALAWLRLAVDPGELRAADLREAARRPSRGRSAKLVDWISEQRSMPALARLAGRLGERDADKVTQLVDDIGRLAAASERGAPALLRMIRDLGLDESMSALDGYQRTPKQAGHLDDLDALVALADLCPDAAGFPQWLREELRRLGDPHGVRLATVHKVKGREWPHVVVHHAGADQMPHRLATDVEEERRVFHVAITRCSETCTVVAPAGSPSPFLAELRGETPEVHPIRAQRTSTAAGRRVSPADSDGPPPDAALLQQLKTWRAGRARADGMPAFVVFHDTTLEEIARRRPATLPELARVKGLGPTKLDRYGDDVLSVVAAAGP